MMAVRSFWPWNSIASGGTPASRRNAMVSRGIPRGRAAFGWGNADAESVRVADLDLDPGLPAHLHKAADEGDDHPLHVGPRGVLEMDAGNDAVGKRSIDDPHVAVQNGLPVRCHLPVDVVIGYRGEDAGLLEPGCSDLLVVIQGCSDPARDLGVA